MGSPVHCLAVSLLYPDLPFLVCPPNFFLGCLAKVSELRNIFPRQSGFHFFSSSSSLACSDLILRLPPEAQFNTVDSRRLKRANRFTIRLTSHIMPLLRDVTASPKDAFAESRAHVSPHTLEADLHFPLFSSPYYGYTPQHEMDIIALLYNLSSFLLYSCYTSGGELSPALEDLSVLPGDLLTICSTLHPSWLSVQPGEGIFFLPISPSRTASCMALLA